MYFKSIRNSDYSFNINGLITIFQQAKVQSPTGGLSTNPFLSTPANNAGGQPIVDLFGAGAQPMDNSTVRNTICTKARFYALIKDRLYKTLKSANNLM